MLNILQPFFFIKWDGYRHCTWEPEENLIDCDELLKDYINAQAHECLSKYLLKFLGKNSKENSFI